MTSFPPLSQRFRPERITVLWAALVLNVELLIVSIYLLTADVTVTDPLMLVYPWVWINVGLWAVSATSPAPASGRHRRLAGALAVGYFGVLAVMGGLLQVGTETGVRIAWTLPPGFGPALIYNGEFIQIILEPYKLVGYVALAYLVYVTILDAVSSALSGVVGLFSCVSCTWPILGTVLTSLFGGSSAVVAFATNQPYAASTIVFLSAVGLLYWRPTM